MWTRGPAMFQAPAASGPAKPFTITFDEAGTPTTYPTALTTYYTASLGVTFAGAFRNSDGYFATGPRTGAAMYRALHATGTLISFDASVATRKVAFYRAVSGVTNVTIYASNGAVRVYSDTGTDVPPWNLFTVDLDAAPYFDAAHWGSAFITGIEFTGSSVLVLIDDFTVL